MKSDEFLNKLRHCNNTKKYDPLICKKDYDHALASYLVFVAQRVNMGCYVRTLKFVLLYRDHFK